MLIELIKYLKKYSSEFTVLLNTKLQIILIFLTSFFISIYANKKFIFWSKKLKIYTNIRVNVPISHKKKHNISPMGGVIIILTVLLETFLWVSHLSMYVRYILFLLLSYSIIGFIDDFKKLKSKDSYGISAFKKYFWQSVIAILIIFHFFSQKEIVQDTRIFIPFFKENYFFLKKVWYMILMYFIIVGTSNAVNLTDGLDGLVVIPIIFVFSFFCLFSWISCDIKLSHYFHIPYMNSLRELGIVCISVIGSSLGFLWFNSYPAKIFMGDVGTLPLGGIMGIMSIMLKREMILLIIGGIFVLETISVILQVLNFKLRKKRIFHMAPYHHHLELNNCAESKIIIYFWIVSSILFLIGILSL